MNKQFTASEVRDLAKRGTDAMQQFIDGRHTLHIPPQPGDADMAITECLRAVDAYADLLEAQERAVPVVTRESAINAIEHVGRYNGPGRETEARQMLVEGPHPSPTMPKHNR